MAIERRKSATQADVLRVLREALEGSDLADECGGNVYIAGERPKGRRAEDIVLQYVTGLGGEVQQGVAQVNVYVPDIQVGRSGDWVADRRRCDALMIMAEAWAGSLRAGSDFRWDLANMVHVAETDEPRQHKVVMRLNYWHY